MSLCKHIWEIGTDIKKIKDEVTAKEDWCEQALALRSNLYLGAACYLSAGLERETAKQMAKRQTGINVIMAMLSLKNSSNEKVFAKESAYRLLLLMTLEDIISMLPRGDKQLLPKILAFISTDALDVCNTQMERIVWLERLIYLQQKTTCEDVYQNGILPFITKILLENNQKTEHHESLTAPQLLVLLFGCLLYQSRGDFQRDNIRDTCLAFIYDKKQDEAARSLLIFALTKSSRYNKIDNADNEQSNEKYWNAVKQQIESQKIKVGSNELTTTRLLGRNLDAQDNYKRLYPFTSQKALLDALFLPACPLSAINGAYQRLLTGQYKATRTVLEKCLPPFGNLKSDHSAIVKSDGQECLIDLDGVNAVSTRIQHFYSKKQDMPKMSAKNVNALIFTATFLSKDFASEEKRCELAKQMLDMQLACDTKIVDDFTANRETYLSRIFPNAANTDLPSNSHVATPLQGEPNIKKQIPH